MEPTQAATKMIKPRELILGLLLLLLVVSGVLIAINRGLHFSEYNFTYELALTAGNEAVLDEYSAKPFVSKVNRAQSRIRFQHIPEANFNKIVTDLGDKVQATRTVEEVLPFGLAGRLLWIGLLSAVVIFAFSYYSFLRRLLKVNPRIVWRSLGVYLLTLAAILLIYIGMLSGLSLVYEVTELALGNMLIASLWSVSVLFLAWRSVAMEKGLSIPTVNSLVGMVGSKINHFVHLVWAPLIILVLLLILGMGNAFILEGLLLLMAFGIGNAALLYLPSFWVKLFDINIKINRGKRRLPTLQVMPSVSAKSSLNSTVQKPKRKLKKTKPGRPPSHQK